MTSKKKTDETADSQDSKSGNATTSPVNRIRFDHPRKNKVGLVAAIAMMLAWVLVMSILAIVVNFA